MTIKDRQTDTVKNEYVQFTLVNGIIQGKFLQPVEWDYDKAVEAVELRLQLNHSTAKPLCLDVRNLVTITKKAREFLSSEEAMQGLSAGAMVIGSYVGKIMGEMFRNLYSPKLPFEIFEDLDDANDWLKQFK